jgi:hypothetical protein
VLKLGAYYVLLVIAGALLVTYVPVAEHAFLSPIVLPGIEGAADIIRGGVPVAPATDPSPLDRGITTALIAIGTFLVVLPVAWVYMLTRRFRYDRALVQSVMILPIVVAGMVMIVKNSLALAFSLAGIVAAVRFRNTLKDTRDAVYIFLALGLGLAAGVQALDIAVVMSLAFNVLVLGLWRTNFAAIYGADRRGDMLAIGDPQLRMARTRSQLRQLTAELAADEEAEKADGALIVQGPAVETVRFAIETVLRDSGGDDWTFREPMAGTRGNVALPVIVKFKKKGTPIEALADLDEYWSTHVTAAEYIPFANGEKKQ